MPQETRTGLNEKTKSIKEVDLQFNFTHVATRKREVNPAEMCDQRSEEV